MHVYRYKDISTCIHRGNSPASNTTVPRAAVLRAIDVHLV